MAYEKLFSPIKIRGMEMRNRVIFPAMGTKMPTEDRYVTQQLIDYHVARAEGGNGLNMLEVTSVHTPSAPKHFLSISEDKYVPKLKELVDAIHQAGGKAGIQLWQGGIAVASDPEAMIVVPIDMPMPGMGVVPAVKKEMIEEIVKAYGQAARRAEAAGFDCIEIHAAHGYSLHTFLSPAFNKREDLYGGSFENRTRYLFDTIREVRKNISEDMPLFMRIGAHDDYVENGLMIEDVIEIARNSKEAGIDVLDISRGNLLSAGIKYEVPSIDTAKGFNVDNASKIKKATGMLTVAVGRINEPEQAEMILVEEKADMVVMGRAQLADAEFCKKAKAGKTESIVYCVGCNQGCFDGFVDPTMPHITCLRNPALGLEKEYALVKTDTPKRVLVIGGGMAGLEAALTLKRRGHHTILCEEGDTLGGQFLLAGAAPRKEEMGIAATKMGELVKREGVDVRMSTKVTPELIEKLKIEEVVIAIGAIPMELDIEGSDLSHVTNSHDVLAGKVVVKGEVVVIGGGLVGLEVAEYLAERDHKVSVVEMLDEVGRDLGQIRKISVMENLHNDQIKTYVNTTCMAIKENSIVIKEQEKTQEIPADFVVIAIGARSRSAEKIINYCQRNGIPYHVIGDALKARRALNATAEAAKIAREI